MGPYGPAPENWFLSSMILLFGANADTCEINFALITYGYAVSAPRVGFSAELLKRWGQSQTGTKLILL